MTYIPHTDKDIKDMLAAIGVTSLDELFDQIPYALRLQRPLNIPPGLPERNLVNELCHLSKKNTTVDEYISFLGAGSYNHYIPSVVKYIVARSEFNTSYTPYQPEVSQGTLQAIFEYQTLICQLTGMEVSNASMYDGASATAEAVLMAGRLNGHQRVILSSALHPEYRETINTYISNQDKTVKEVTYCTATGKTLPEAVEAQIGNEPSCLVVQHPNFFGSLEDIAALRDLIHNRGGLLIVVITEPISLGLLTPPGSLGADIVVGEGQSLGNNMAFGGPYLGFFATREEYIRQVPGRIVGQTTDSKGKRGFCLTLATREQHIRREKATSNICTNEGLCAISAAVFLSVYGKKGLIDLARLNFSKSQYLKNSISKVAGTRIAFSSPTFNEFVIESEIEADVLLKALLKKGILGGISLKKFYPELSRHLLLCATEMNSREEMDTFVEEFSKL